MTRDIGWLFVGIAAWLVWLVLWPPITAWRMLNPAAAAISAPMAAH